MSTKVYTAGAMAGKDYKDVVAYFRRIHARFEKLGFTVLFPTLGKEKLIKQYKRERTFSSKGRDDIPTSTTHAITRRDHWMVCGCDVFYLDLNECPDRVTIGSIMELAWAYDRGKHTVIVMGENNIHDHAFIRECADIVFPTEEDAFDYFANFRVLIEEEKNVIVQEQ